MKEKSNAIMIGSISSIINEVLELIENSDIEEKHAKKDIIENLLNLAFENLDQRPYKGDTFGTDDNNYNN